MVNTRTQDISIIKEAQIASLPTLDVSSFISITTLASRGEAELETMIMKTRTNMKTLWSTPSRKTINQTKAAPRIVQIMVAPSAMVLALCKLRFRNALSTSKPIKNMKIVLKKNENTE